MSALADATSLAVLERGEGELVGWADPDEMRAWMREHKPNGLKDKRLSAAEAVETYVNDGDLIASGGFGHVRVSTALIHEIIRQGVSDLTLAGKTAVYDSDLLIAANAVDRVEAAYSFAHEARGLAPASRRRVEGGDCEVVAEISNAGLQWRFLAAKMGLPFVPSRILAGTDTFAKSSAVRVEGPFAGKPLTLLPACYPDVAVIHVSRCDRYGNSQIDGITVEDPELAAAAKRLIVSTEEVVDEDTIRDAPDETVFPHFLVDAVVEQPYGGHPGDMLDAYYFDETHIAEWLERSRTDEGVEGYMAEYIHDVPDFDAYLEKIGGEERLAELEAVEHYEQETDYPWVGGDD